MEGSCLRKITACLLAAACVVCQPEILERLLQNAEVVVGDGGVQGTIRFFRGGYLHSTPSKGGTMCSGTTGKMSGWTSPGSR